MSVWQIVNNFANDVAALVIPEAEQADMKWWKKFVGDGSTIRWRKRPKLELYVPRGRKKPKTRSDLSLLTAPGFVLSAKAKDALGDFLA